MTPLVKDIIMSSTRMPALFLGHGSPMNVLAEVGDDIATPASDCGGFGSLVYPWNRSDRDGDAAHDS